MSEVHENTENEEFVPKKAYQQVSKDMHDYKAKMKELTAQLETMKADQEAKENATLLENEKWKELFQKSESKLKELETVREKEKLNFVEGHKKNAVLQQIQFKKQDYLKFVDTSKIGVNEDGSINQDSIQSEVERLRKEYPELIKQNDKQGLPDAAPKGFQPKSLSEMTREELAEARRQALKK